MALDLIDEHSGLVLLPLYRKFLGNWMHLRLGI
jgi:hypothetical protein